MKLPIAECGGREERVPKPPPLQLTPSIDLGSTRGPTSPISSRHTTRGLPVSVSDLFLIIPDSVPKWKAGLGLKVEVTTPCLFQPSLMFLMMIGSLLLCTLARLMGGASGLFREWKGV